MDEDFASMFEQRLRSPKPGDVVSGRVVRIGPDIVTIDIGYKSEGQVARQEFTTREGELTVHEGDTVEKRRAVREFLQANLQRPDLTPEFVARTFAMSRARSSRACSRSRREFRLVARQPQRTSPRRERCSAGRFKRRSAS